MCRFDGNTEDRFSRVAAHIKITSSYFSFGLMPAQVLNVRSPLPPNQSASASLPLNTQGPVQKMEPLTTLQVMSARDLFVLFDLIPNVPSTIFQLNRDGSSWVEPVLS